VAPERGEEIASGVAPPCTPPRRERGELTLSATDDARASGGAPVSGRSKVKAVRPALGVGAAPVGGARGDLTVRERSTPGVVSPPAAAAAAAAAEGDLLRPREGDKGPTMPDCEGRREWPPRRTPSAAASAAATPTLPATSASPPAAAGECIADAGVAAESLLALRRWRGDSGPTELESEEAAVELARGVGAALPQPKAGTELGVVEKPLLTPDEMAVLAGAACGKSARTAVATTASAAAGPADARCAAR